MRECTINLNFFFTCNQNIAKYFIRVASSGETFIRRTQFSAVIDARAAKLSDYSYPTTKKSNWTAVIGYPRDRATIT